MSVDIPDFLLQKAEQTHLTAVRRSGSGSYVDKGIAGFARIIRQTFLEWELASRQGFLQSLDSRVKILFWIGLLIAISLKKGVVELLIIAIALALLGLFSRVRLPALYGRVIPLSFFFGFLVSAPAMLNVILPGTIVAPIIDLPVSYSFWIYSIPQQIGITEEGIGVCFMLTLRVFDSLSLSFLMLATTPFAEIVKALKLFRIPDELLLIITLTYKYIYLFAQTITDMYRAKKARLVLGVSASEFRNWSAGRMVTIFRKTEQRVDDIYRAMLSRGFSGEIRLPRKPAVRASDLIGAAVLASFVFAALLV
jgi:cobalt/nickel transport system permease protein